MSRFRVDNTLGPPRWGREFGHGLCRPAVPQPRGPAVPQSRGPAAPPRRGPAPSFVSPAPPPARDSLPIGLGAGPEFWAPPGAGRRGAGRDVCACAVLHPGRSLAPAASLHGAGARVRSRAGVGLRLRRRRPRPRAPLLRRPRLLQVLGSVSFGPERVPPRRWPEVRRRGRTDRVRDRQGSGVGLRARAGVGPGSGRGSRGWTGSGAGEGPAPVGSGV